MVDLNALLRREISSNTKIWTLKNNDTGEIISGQYTPQDYTENAGAKIPEVSTVNNQEPFPQWVGGEGKTSSFSARIYQSNSLVTVKEDIEKLQQATEKDPKLFRAPIFTFTWGLEIAFKCFVASVGGVKYDEINENGTIRGASFNIVLRRLENLPTTGLTKLGDISSLSSGLKGFLGDIGVPASFLTWIPGGSLHTKGRTIIAKDGDTFESIAKKEYGDALVGDILRRVQPAKANLKPGDEVILVVDNEIFEIEVRPQANALERTNEAKAVREIMFANRNRKQIKAF